MFDQKILLSCFFELTKHIHLNDNLIMQDKPGHTKEASLFDKCANGRETALYYALATYLEQITEEKGLAILSEIEKLQDTNATSSTFGCLRWYREETHINDSNGAFFVLRPLVFALLWCKDRISQAQRDKIRQMLENAYSWFFHEIDNPILYYPNKIMSDGAMLSAISTILGMQEGMEKSVQFWNNWLGYTKKRGWGWGENTSVCYLGIMLDAINYTLKTIQDEKIIMRLQDHKNNLLSFIKFHGGYEFVPSIRTYNLAGDCMNPSEINAAAGVRFCKEEIGHSLMALFSFIVETEITGLKTAPITDKIEPPAQIIKFERKEHIFDDCYSYTWIGKHLRMGSINHFPVMSGSYQNAGWGLGWQSMPISFLVYHHQLSFLRFSVKEGNNHRTHIAHDKHQAYLDNALFAETHIPDVYTMCAQHQNALLIIRCMDGIANSAREIADEWYIQNFKGEVEVMELSQKWYTLKFDACVVAICPLGGIDYNLDYRSLITTKAKNENGNLSISQSLYGGEEKLLYKPHLESAWAVVCFDSSENIREGLSKIKLLDEELNDTQIPRNGYTKIRKLNYQDKDKSFSLCFDPHLKKSVQQ